MLWRARPGLLCAVLARPALWQSTEQRLSLVAAAATSDTDLSLLAGSLGGQLDGIVHCYGILLRTVRTSSVLLLLGVGTLVCCRLYARYTGGGGGGGGGDGDSGWRRLLRTLLGTDWTTPPTIIEDEDDLTPDDDIQPPAPSVTDVTQETEQVSAPAQVKRVHYFGPSEYYGPPLAPSARLTRSARSAGTRGGAGDRSDGAESGCSTDLSASASADSLQYLGDHSASYSVGDQFASDDEAECSSLEPDMGNKTSKNFEPVFYNKDAGVIFNRLQADQLVSSSGSSSTGSPQAAAAAARRAQERTETPQRAPPLKQVRRRVIVPHVSAGGPTPTSGRPRAATSADSGQSGSSTSPRARSLPPASPASAARRQLLRRQLRDASQQGGSVDLSVSELCRMCRDGSFDSSASDLSLDLAWADGLGSSTVDFLDQLESQLDVLKLDMSTMDSNLVTLHFPHQEERAGRRQLGKSASEHRLRSDASLGGLGAGPAAAAAGAAAEWSLDSPPVTDGSLEWDSPVHGWSAVPRAARPPADGASSAGRPSLSRSQSASSSLRRSPSLELRAEDMPSLEWDNSGITEYPETWQEDADAGDSRPLGDELALELDLELELGSRGSRDSASLRSLDPRTASDEREGSAESSATTVQESRASSASRQGSLTLALSREHSPLVDPLTESGYEGMDSSAVLTRTPLSPVAETHAESGALSSDSAVSGSTDRLNGNPTSGTTTSGEQQRRANRDSAYWDDGLDTLAARAALETVGESMDLVQYGQQEWRGTTPRATTMRQGYEEMASRYGLTHLQRVRGDNYCAVRAALYQLLAKGLPPPNANRCRHLLDSAGDWVTAWSFGSRLPYDVSTARAGIHDCLSTLSQLGEELRSCAAPGRQLRQRWNADPDLDLRCMEAVKLHMLAEAVQLERDQARTDRTVPLFAMLLFARDTSSTPRELMVNHLNHVGDSGGLEQIEMFLLGHALEATLRVIRPGAHGQEDFVTFYPDDAPPERPVLTLVAEDDRHYNVAS
ncbi:uncharacterized protein LOC122387834 isoform X2 [Amphibalanus amphitrite]|uniref:uncharacterized protein LOC122387834 isoform X2 n=1 Tax=Amphibalanus amphitrite TaxID=1232801 RepID=UPI001C90F83B|nr:uncharacterized protein LOC122387834 isoform X2 [Amphibalanus amphitrite]XP_043234322.1 uncharacterized protein LOC122387834 isoform X2 [Amphibalanus amphitrite]